VALLADVGQLGPGWFGAPGERGPPIEARSRSFAPPQFMLRWELTPYQGLCDPWEESFRPRCAGGE